jgi:hypothetical protein
MKKVIFAIAAASLALLSCTKFESEPEVSFETAAAPTVNVEVTGDNSIAIEVLPGSNTGYYAYALFEGEVEASSVDAATLLAGKAGGLRKETASAAKKDTLKAAVAKLSANTKYTVVAVASSKGTQSLSEVVGQTVTTTDETVPDVDDYDYDVDGKSLTFYVLFDDPVQLTDTATFYVRYFAKNYAGAAPTYILQPIAQTIIPKENVSLENGEVVISVPEDNYAPGAYVALYIGEGAVVNALGSVNEAFTANRIILKGDYTSYTTGLLAQFEPANFDLESPIAEDSLVKFQDPSALEIELAAKLEGKINQLVGYGKGEVTVTAVNSVSGRKVEYTLENWGVNSTKDGVVLGLDEAPDFGYYSSYSVAEGIVEDLYGNVNKEFTIEDQVFCSYGYKTADILGTYTFAGTSQYAGAQAEDKVVIAPSDDKDYDLVVYDLFKSTTCLNDLDSWTPDSFTKFYADFDVDSGVLTVYGDKIGVGVYSGKEYTVGALGDGEDDEFVFNVVAPGQAVLGGTVYMYLYKGGTWDRVTSGTLTRTATTYAYTEPAAPTAAPKKLAKVGGKVKSLR